MKKPSKNMYRGILIFSFLAVNAMIIFGLSSVLGFLNSGADKSSIFHSGKRNETSYRPKIAWDTSNYEGRKMESPNLQKIERDYLHSWQVRNFALNHLSQDGIADYFTDSARVNLLKNVEFNKKTGVVIKSTSLYHQPKLNFYSTDGQLVSFTDENVVTYQESFLNEELIATSMDTSRYEVLMLLEDGYWRVRHMVREEAQQTPAPRKPAISTWKIRDGKLYWWKEEFKLKGVNYYPKDGAWDTFGLHFSQEEIDQDLQIISQLGLNTIRIFLQYEDFGKEHVLPEKLEKLATLLDLADKHSLKVIVTLFDFYGDYSVTDWNFTYAHARQITRHFKDHTAILAWDLKNEPDLDFDSRGKIRILNWLKHLSREVKQADPNHLVTIGWGKPQNASLLQENMDLLSFHYYGKPEALSGELKNLRKKVQKPLILEEFGLSSYKGFWDPFGNTEEDQQEYYAAMNEVLEEEQLYSLFWTLYDFKEIPNSVVGKQVWRKAKQKHFGVIDAQGTPKASFCVIHKQ
ncbi:glycoside hydrolase family 2 TIM barrel-domain containing protein [Christiangramia flava]|uniref:Uncharacterized protein n=1 Tax=Christiangramia flava JLT2011 TaxID=1229726 RepID=A0A1L7I5Y3_9FLAO|nr:glycoside hydrolase family 2 TIM barrel-domain containing protein [Christiangramia flava]APU69000.1 hypothetical protein GRFL_2276 [Christiangramia flava JLT2011]OSS38526.1 hypothetical protein C723_2509 [Christiangramia flava JLT2011]